MSSSLVVSGLIFGVLGAIIGKNKEVGPVVGFFLGLFLSLVGIIILVCMSGKKDNEYNEFIANMTFAETNDKKTSETPVQEQATENDILKWRNPNDKTPISEEELERMKSKLRPKDQ